MPTTRELQRALLDLGYDVGPIDGVIGRRTREAAKKFQKDNNLEPDGIIGPFTTAVLMSKGVLRGENTPVIPGEKQTKRQIVGIVIHCTATPEGRNMKRADIDRMHRERGWDEIGYHGLWLLDGTFVKGRAESKVGAHVAGHNAKTLGYAYVGGLGTNGEPKDTRTKDQKAAMVETIRVKAATYGVRWILGHRDLSPDLDGDGVVEPPEWIKVCPCFDVVPEYGHLLR